MEGAFGDADHLLATRRQSHVKGYAFPKMFATQPCQLVCDDVLRKSLCS